MLQPIYEGNMRDDWWKLLSELLWYSCCELTRLNLTDYHKTNNPRDIGEVVNSHLSSFSPITLIQVPFSLPLEPTFSTFRQWFWTAILNKMIALKKFSFLWLYYPET